MIIETSCNRFFKVKPATAPGHEHLWLGIEVKNARGGWKEKRRAFWQLVRKAATRVVEA